MVLGAQGTVMNKVDIVLNFSKFWASGVPDSMLAISVDVMQEVRHAGNFSRCDAGGTGGSGRIEGHGKLA